MSRASVRRRVRATSGPCATDCRTRWLGFRRGVTPRAVPPLPARDLRRGHRAGSRDRAAARRAREQPGQPRLPLLRSARLRQDHLGADPGPRPQLRAGADRRPVRRVRQLPRPRPRRRRLDRRDRDRRRVARWRRRRPRPAREGVLRAGARAATRSTSSTRPTWSPPQGFNALLKLVEEPPPHLRFIFATTEPEKVIATIRSRTHHYPFRLIPPRLLSDYLAELAAKEGVAIEPAALPLVVRAGGGSARDTLSVLDQLIGGSRARGRHPRSSRPGCSATPPTPCSTRWSTRSPPLTVRRSSGSSTR